MARCTAAGANASMETVGDLVASREAYRVAYESCAAKIDAIRKWDADARK